MSIRKPLRLQREKSDPNVTVLMSVYNGEKHLREAIDSVLGQTFDSFELLIIDDASTDGTAEILRSLSDSKITITRNKENMGLPKSLNKGLKLARGEYVARLDADDIAMPTRIERQAQHLDEHLEVGLVVSGVNVINERGELTYTYLCNLSSEELYYSLLFCNCFPHSSAMFRKSTILDLGGYDERFTRASDYDLWSRIRAVARIDSIGQPLIEWRDSVENMSTTFKTEQDEAAYCIFTKNIEALMGAHYDVRRVRCFHDEGFPDRSPVVTSSALLELERIQMALAKNCPPWINRGGLATLCDDKLQQHVYSMLKERHFAGLLPLLRHKRFCELFLKALKQKSGRVLRV